MKPKRKRAVALLTAVALAAVLCASAARADVVYTNLGDTDSYDPMNYFWIGDSLKVAMKFTVSGGDYTLSAVELVLKYYEAPASLNVSVATDAGGVPGSTIESIPFTESSATPHVASVASVARPLLENGATYWVVVEAADAASQVIWYTSAVDGSGGFAYSDPTTGGAWIAAGGPAFAFRVSGDAGTAAYTLVDLHPGGLQRSWAVAVNASGRMIGIDYTPAGPYPDTADKRAFYWESGGSPTLLPGLPLGGTVTAATGLNEAGQIVGYSGGNYDNTGNACTWIWDSASGTYVVVDLGTAGRAFYINASGQIIGNGQYGSGYLWQPAGDGTYSAHVLPLPDNGRYEPGSHSVFYINDAGLIVGSAGLLGYTGGFAVVWENGADLGGFRELPPLTRNVGGIELTDNFTEPWGVNESGVVVGYSGDYDWNYSSAVYWEKDGTGAWVTHELPGLGQVFYETCDINEAGQILGFGHDLAVGPSTPLVWEKDAFGDYQIQVLPKLNPTDTYVRVYDINNLGQVVGASGANSGAYHAVLWQKDAAGTWQVQDLGTLGGSISRADAINDAGLIVGTSLITGNATQHAIAAIPAFQPVNQPPWAYAGDDQSVTVPHDGSAATNTAPVTLDASGSVDPDGDPLTYSWIEDGAEIATGVTPLLHLAAGVHVITLIATDPFDGVGIDEVAITVNAESNAAPFANAGPDQELTTSTGSAAVTLDGSGCTDPDGDVLSCTWTEEATVIATGEQPSVSLGLGTHTITLTVTDDYGASASDEVVVTVSPPPSALEVSKLSLVCEKRTVVVTVLVTNPDTLTSRDTLVTAATLGGVACVERLPIGLGAIKPDKGKTLDLTFKNVPPGEAALEINGVCSLGNFAMSQTVTIP